MLQLCHWVVNGGLFLPILRRALLSKTRSTSFCTTQWPANCFQKATQVAEESNSLLPPAPNDPAKQARVTGDKPRSLREYHANGICMYVCLLQGQHSITYTTLFLCVSSGTQIDVMTTMPLWLVRPNASFPCLFPLFVQTEPTHNTASALNPSFLSYILSPLYKPDTWLCFHNLFSQGLNDAVSLRLWSTQLFWTCLSHGQSWFHLRFPLLTPFTRLFMFWMPQGHISYLHTPS